MNSGSHRGFTVVTIITMIFAPIFLHHHWMYRLASVTSETHSVRCVVHEPCPASQTIVKIVVQPLPRGAGNHEDGQGGQGNVEFDGTTLASLSTALAP